ncbi:MAG: DUF4340 domain-containing protein [Bacteroidota bacterium]
MKLSTRNLIAVLAILAIILVVVQLTKRDNKSKTLKSELVTIDTAKVSKVEVTSGEEKLTLEKMEGAWTVSTPIGMKAAKSSSINALFSNLENVKPSRLVAKREASWPEFKVDSTGTRIKIYEGDKLATDLVVGRFGMEGQQSFFTYVRLFEDAEVYLAQDFMGMSINASPRTFRNDVVAQFTKDSIAQIAFNYPDSSFLLSREGATWNINENAADSSGVADYLQKLRSVRSSTFLDTEANLKVTHSIQYSLFDGTTTTVEADLSSNTPMIRSSQNSDENFSDNQLVEKLFKGPNAFLATN